MMITLWCFSASANPADNASYLDQWLQRPQLRFAERTVDTTSLRRFYTDRTFQPVWIDENNLNQRGAAVLAVLAQASQHGLNKERYYVNTIQTVSAMHPADETARTQQVMSLELLLSAGVMAYAADMQGGTVAPQWNTGKAPTDTTQQITALQQAAQASNPAATVAALAPNTQAYNGLKAALQHYQSLAVEGGWPTMAEGGKILPNQQDARIDMVRRILIAQGDLPQAAYPKDTYDAATVEGVKHFQVRHGLAPDGVIAKTTQEALNMPVAARIQQIQMSMERMRWMPHDLGTRYVLVNIPAYQLSATSGANHLAMKVIVGKPGSKTPLFSKEITNVVLNPSWSVPAKIAANEMLPKIQKNPGYLSKAGFSVIDASGQEVAPETIDWSSVGRNHFAYTLRQDSGDSNALGKVKFTIPDSDNIYLHDTSNRGLFARSERSLSHGCVRLSDPRALTEFVLNDAGWDSKKIDTAYDSDSLRTVRIAPLPVHMVYWTAWVDNTGQTHFNRDIYGLDRPLLLAMGGGPKMKTAIALAMR